MNKKEYQKRYRELHKEELKKYREAYNEKHKNEIKEKKRAYYLKNKDRIKAKTRKYYTENREYILERESNYRKSHKKEISKYQKEYAIKNKDKIRRYRHDYNIKNREKLSIKAKEYQRIRRNNDNVHKFKMQVRHLIWLSFNKKGGIKSKKTEDILGCDLDFFVNYLLDTYKNNYGIEWDKVEKVHIDHIVPLVTAKTEEDIMKLCHYTNLQLLKAIDNLHKSFKEV